MQRVVRLRALNQRVQRVRNALVCLPYLAAQRAERVRGVVAHHAPVADAPANLPRQFAQIGYAFGEVGEQRGMLSHREDAGFRARLHINRLRYGEQFHARENAADGRAHDRFFDVVGAEHIHLARLVKHRAPLRRLLLQDSDFVVVIRRAQF